jgi:hypothetical protein
VRPRRALVGHGADEAANLLVGGDAVAVDAFDALGQRTEHVGEDLAVERRLVVEVVVEHRLVEARPGGDAIDFGAVEPARGELERRRRNQPIAGRLGIGTRAAAGDSALLHFTNWLVKLLQRPWARQLVRMAHLCSLFGVLGSGVPPRRTDEHSTRTEAQTRYRSCCNR